MIHRASSLGGCLKGQIAAALGQKPIPHDDASLTRMGEGEIHERDVIARLTADGYTVTRQQEEVNLRPIKEWNHIYGSEVCVQGHLDGVINNGAMDSLMALGNPFIHYGSKVLEVKSMSDAAWKDFQSKGWHADWPAGSLIDKYRWQLSVYMLATGLEGLLVTKNRNSGQMTQHGIETPYYTLDQITERVAYIEDHIARGELPDDCPHDWFCPHKYLCGTKPNMEEQGISPDSDELEDPIMEAAAAEFVLLGEQIKVLEARKSEMRAELESRLDGRKKAMVGRYRVTWVEKSMPESVRKAYTMSYPIVKRIEETD